jgi:hypothetical protein
VGRVGEPTGWNLRFSLGLSSVHASPTHIISCQTMPGSDDPEFEAWSYVHAVIQKTHTHVTPCTTWVVSLFALVRLLYIDFFRGPNPCSCA